MNDASFSFLLLANSFLKGTIPLYRDDSEARCAQASKRSKGQKQQGRKQEENLQIIMLIYIIYKGKYFLFSVDQWPLL